MTARLTRVSLGRGSSATEEPLDRDEALVADVDAVLVHVQRDVRGAHLVRHLLREGADVLTARLRMREGVLDGGADRSLGGVADLVVEIGPGEDPRERDGQAGFAFPPLPEICHGDQAMVGVRETALVDDEPGVDLTGDDGRENLVVAQLDYVAERGRRE